MKTKPRVTENILLLAWVSNTTYSALNFSYLVPSGSGGKQEPAFKIRSGFGLVFLILIRAQETAVALQQHRQINNVPHWFGIDFHQLEERPRSMDLAALRIPFSKGALGHSGCGCIVACYLRCFTGFAGTRRYRHSLPEYRSISEKYRQARSCCKKLIALIKAKRYRVINVDASVCLETPKIMQYAGAMRAIIAGILEITIDDVSIKATTTEKMGFIGRGEGLAAYANCAAAI